LAANPHALPAENTLVGIPLNEGRKGINGIVGFVPWIGTVIHAIFVDQVLEITLSPLFTGRAHHSVIEKDKA
jgi:hypothetical protein